MRGSSLTIATLALFAGCAPPPYEPGDTSPVEDTSPVDDTAPAEDTAPSLKIVWPAPEAAVTGCAMLVVEVTNVELTDFMISLDPVEGQGHYHVLYEGGRYAPCSTPYCLIDMDVAGYSYVEVHLVGNDHTPLLNEDDKPIVEGLPLNVSIGECTLGTPSGSN